MLKSGGSVSAFQVRRSLLAPRCGDQTVLNMAAKLGNTGMWVTVTSVLNMEDLLEEVHSFGPSTACWPQHP